MTEPSPRLDIGILGGGQLGRMLALSGYPLGYAFHVLDPKDRVSASKVCHHIQADYDDPEALDELRDVADVITYEFENVPEAALERVDERPIFPPKRALEVSDDRLVEKKFFHDLDIGTVDIHPVASEEDLADAVDKLGLPLVLKTRTMGYDGKGQARVEQRAQVSDAWEAVGEVPSIAEGFADFDRELSVLGVRARDGTKRIYPVVENIHHEGILVESRAPATFDAASTCDEARSYSRRLLDELDYVGTLALELFDTGDELLANEMAPRVHNSGHWTIEGAETSQFENHVRAVAGVPLSGTDAVGHTRMINVIGEHPDRQPLLDQPGAHVHDYEKSPRPGRKIGHVTVRADTAEQADGYADQIRPVIEAARDLG
ncbi:MAG: 5-(carboxyamino)imidazole ribonucleotide synthase [Bradymonadaceae bacterium]